MTIRIAYLGPAPTDDGGVPYMAGRLLSELPKCGLEVDAYLASAGRGVPPELRDIEGLTFLTHDSGWRYDQWYSKTALTKLVGGLMAKAAAQHALLRELVKAHERDPYRCLYQFNQFELLGVRALRSRLPPIVVHPEVHARGESRWHASERRDGLAVDRLPAHLAVRSMLRTRALVQRYDARLADHIICPSETFAREIQRDYGVDPRRCTIIPNPVDLERFVPADESPATPPVRFVFISRIAARKGVEMIVDLARRLDDLAGKVQIDVVGGPSLWSDYRHLLEKLNPRIATYLGDFSGDGVPALLQSSHGLLQPSHYEPFALTVGEAMACGVPVIVSEAVGAGERLEPRCCRRFPTGDAGGFEREVRRLAAEVLAGDAARLAELTRSEVGRRFAPRVVAAAVADVLMSITKQPRTAPAVRRRPY